MTTGRGLLREHKYRELWGRYCGFIDLSLMDFMGIQRHLLEEQLQLLNRCELGQGVMRGARPPTVEEFREQVPLTTYADYAPHLMEQREDILPARPLLWQRTSGASGEYSCKWAPVSERMYQSMATVAFAILILATCKRRYDISFGEGEKLLYALAPPPYATGCWSRAAAQELPISFLPSSAEAEALPFEERLALGLRQGLSQGIDLVFGLPSVLVAVGEKMGQGSSSKGGLGALLKDPRAMFRVGRGLAKSRLARRPLCPKDLWRLRGIATAGSDSSIYRRRIEKLWGQTPLDVYGCTEGLIIAMQTWDRQGMTFLPHLNFLEFIPEPEHRKARANPGYAPRTVLLDEVEAGQNYEIVITNFLGGAFVRYRLGDMVTITARRNEKLNIDIPQMTFYSRADSIIDIAGFTRLTERTLAQALEAAGVACQEWVARKEAGVTPVLHLYLEVRGERPLDPRATAAAIHGRLKALDRPYAEVEELLGLMPIEVTFLTPGSFSSYVARQRARGADLAHLKPPHINPSEDILADLLQSTPARPQVTVAQTKIDASLTLRPK